MADISDLKKIFDMLDEERQRSLLDFAEFLQSRGDLKPVEIGEPLDIPRPEDETVVGAIKRLKQTYPMIDSMAVFSEASSLMTDHMVSGRDRVEVIDEMQVLFQQAYEKLLQDD